MAQPYVAPLPDDQHSRLRAVGTKLEYLQSALYAGEAARRTATPNHPANTAGTRAYQEHVRVLRETHIQHEGWQRLRLDYLELVCNPDRTKSIGVMIGDAATGNPRFVATNLHRRGGATQRAAENNAQLALFPEPALPDEVLLGTEESTRLERWFLVSYRVQVDEAVRIHSELSLPRRVEGGFVVEWQDRILLPVLEMEGVSLPDEDGPDEIDISVDFR
ncbi:hypothetical protein ACFO3J_23690 [Streptomyces polygonati]|uniref:Uncharacterized protein n=1 Tax=Streptomyces polygonati TaxID=1617087 RepID=A0ABV8HX80_9ACTN